MVRSLHKTKILFAVATILATPAYILSSAKAANPENVQFQVNIAEALTLTITDPTDWAEGNLTNTNPTTGNLESDFLRNKVNVAAKANSGIGITVSMYTKGDTDLRNTATYSSSDASTSIPTLNSTSGISVQPGTNGANFPTNYWGYSVDDTTTLNPSSHYQPLSTSAIQLFTTVGSSPVPVGVEQSQDVYFGAKADQTKQSGTYTRTVYFAAVTGTIDTTNPDIPTNPSTPDPINNAAHYSSAVGQTTYTQRSTTGSGTGATDATATQVTQGDVSTTYAQAYGVTSSNSSALATAFAVAAGVAATSGIFFFVAAKRRKDDDEDEEGK